MSIRDKLPTKKLKNEYDRVKKELKKTSPDKVKISNKLKKYVEMIAEDERADKILKQKRAYRDSQKRDELRKKRIKEGKR